MAARSRANRDAPRDIDFSIDWDLAECRKYPPTRDFDPWYPVSTADRGASKVGSSEQRKNELREAREVCGVCPIRQACANYALETGNQWGTWGGMTDSERRLLLAGRGVSLNRR